jgi:hypothetical protein
MWIPRKMAGSEINRMLLLIVAIRTPRVVLDSTIHLYDARSSCGPGAVDRAVRAARCGG